MWSIISYWLFAELNYRCMSTRSPLARRVTKQCRERAPITDDLASFGPQAKVNHPAGMSEKIQSNLRMYNSIRMHVVQGVAHWMPSKFTPLYVPPNTQRLRKAGSAVILQSTVAHISGLRAS